MDTDKLTSAIRRIRQELLIMDEPLKAYNLLRDAAIPELKDEENRTYGLVRHVFEPEIYEELMGDDPVEDCELIEPRDLILNAQLKYPRYGWILEEVEKEKPKTYLDLACYVGSLVTSVANKGVKAYGVDMTKRVIEVAKQRAAGLNAEFFVGDATTFDKVKADMVSAFEVIEHVVDPKQFVEHLCSLSKGWVYISTPNGPFGNGAGNIGHWDWDGVKEHIRPHVRVFTKTTLGELLKECSCEVSLLEEKDNGVLWAKFRKAKK